METTKEMVHRGMEKAFTAFADHIKSELQLDATLNRIDIVYVIVQSYTDYKTTLQQDIVAVYSDLQKAKEKMKDFFDETREEYYAIYNGNIKLGHNLPLGGEAVETYSVYGENTERREEAIYSLGEMCIDSRVYD